ncbi:MAG: ribulose-phosphate 3-epimerase [Anaerolineae bacterium]|nr:ribulose-phosphate 3-epimerase [Anaerolineae bacterium]
MNSFTLCPSILSADFARLREQIQEVEAAGADWIHVDVMDGHFVPNLTMGPFIVETIRRITQLPIDAHLMVTDPDRMIPWYAAAGATNLSVQIETCPHIYRTIQVIRDAGCRPGVVLNPGTPAEAIEEVLPLVDVVLVMTVNPGFSGQTFIPAMLSKIERVSRLIEKTNSQAQIQVDGGNDASN